MQQWWKSILSGDLHLHVNLGVSVLVEEALKKRLGRLSADGALVVNSGRFTGRAAEDKYIVKNDDSLEVIDWESKVSALSEEKFQDLKTELLTKIHMMKPEVYISEATAGAMDEYSLGVNLITTSPVHALFTRLIMRERKKENPLGEFTIYHDPQFEFDAYKYGLRSETVIAINFTTREIIIGGTAYCGEIKKSIFTVMNTLLPDQGVLPMHSGANVNKDGDVSVFFGLSGTGKTTLSTDTGMKMIGDDEHGLCSKGIFNFEGGCYAKTFKLKKESEPEIFVATNKFGSLMENVVIDPETRVPDFGNKSITENGRSTYSLKMLESLVPEGIGGIPKNFFFLSADAMGVLPPIGRLSNDQAMYYFLLGYTAKVGGTETGLKGVKATFSHCFGAPFMMRKPHDYGVLLKELLRKYQINVWLVNTGWYGGPYGVGKRFDIGLTRSCVRAIQDGSDTKAQFSRDEIFGLEVPGHLPGVDDRFLDPRALWEDENKYLSTARELKRMFDETYQKLLRREQNALQHQENLSLH